MFGFVLYTHSELTYNKVYYYPPWAIAVGWIMALTSIAMIPIVMVVKIFQTPGTLSRVSPNKKRQISYMHITPLLT